LRATKATKRQLWALYTLTGKDYRDSGITKEEARSLISELKKEKQKELEKFKNLIERATLAANIAADDRLEELERQGPRYAVIDCDPITGKEKPDGAHIDPETGKQKPGWQMLDLCGGGWVRLSYKGKNRKFINALKRIGKGDGSGSWWDGDGWSLQKMNKGFGLSFRIMRQEVSVHQAALEAAEKVLTEAGIDCWTFTYLD